MSPPHAVASRRRCTAHFAEPTPFFFHSRQPREKIKEVKQGYVHICTCMHAKFMKLVMQAHYVIVLTKFHIQLIHILAAIAILSPGIIEFY
jgi:hypothetical protein